MTKLEIRLCNRTITLSGPSADRLVALLIAQVLLIPWMIAAIWS